MFAPVLFSIATVPTNDSESLIAQISEPLKPQTASLDTGFMFDFGALTFINKHPQLEEVLVEVQAHSEEARTQAITILTDIVANISESSTATLNWNDVTEQALVYHANLKAEEN
jgi:hypothetical protein